MNFREYFTIDGKCDKCKDQEWRFKWPYGYVSIEGASWKMERHWYLCEACHKNARTATEGKQWPLWYFKSDPIIEDGKPKLNANGKPMFNNYLENSGKTIWQEKGRTYGHQLQHPGARSVTGAS
jgi:hypothetical protein